MASKNADLSVRVTEGASVREALPLLGILALGLVVRLLFLPSEGYKNDIDSFESWALTLYDHGVRAFYHSTSFVDYPPGYLWVLAAVGWIYHVLHVSDGAAGYYVLRDLIKLPGILADLGCAAVIYSLALRFVPRAGALGAAALFALNPATIYISAYWGQVDAVSALFALGALLATLRRRPLWAWTLLSIAVLVKPQALVLAPLIVVYDALQGGLLRRPLRWIAGPALAVAIGYLIAAPFAPQPWNPIGTLAWLIERYLHGTAVYPYSSINAFNIYAVARSFWQPDAQTIGFLPQSAWGIALVLAACAMIVWRYAQRRDDRSFLEAGLLVSLALFLFATRMHERYIYNGFAIALLLAPMARRYLVAALLLSATLFANLVYSYDYLGVMNNHVAGVDPTNLMPTISHPAALANVLLFAYLSYVFLGGEEPAGASSAAVAGSVGGMEQAQPPAQGWVLLRERIRSWFSPLEGTDALTRLDWLIAIGLGVACFVLVMIDIARPKTQIFDEIYYARTAKEYLLHKDVFEWTHPPLTKLLIALGIIFNGGYPRGFTSFGWRLASAVMGSLTVPLIYAFAKRLLRSTPFAAVAALLLVLSGFHYVQSRIGTPEITVAFFALASLYCAYRYVLATQIRVVERLRESWRQVYAAGIAAAAIAGLLAAWLTGLTPFIYGDGRPDDTAARIGVFIVVGAGVYLAARLLLPRLCGDGERIACYADGSEVSVAGREVRIACAASEMNGKRTPAYRREGLQAGFSAEGALTYATSEGSCLFQTDGTMSIEPGSIRLRARDATLWMWLMALALAGVVDSKWNGLFTLFWVVMALAIVVSQRLWCRPAQWGNPRGIPLDIVYAAILLVVSGVYVLSYIPYFTLGHNLSDLMGLQRQMFLYHDELKATHPYQSRWWEWPLIWRPISYYYHDFGGARHIVAEILALPNPVNWWLGLLSVPAMFVIGLLRRHKGFALLIGAYLWQWLPWITSPRITFEYHFFPNLAVICIANALVLQEVWRSWGRWGRIAVGAFLLAVAWAFVFWFPIWIGSPVPYEEWRKRMLMWLVGTHWI
ncbi:MAG: phospholipid carrier-dependent glycosyltransferase [bacterium]|nr:phospholipid carrier-dependent glycosyltransferase [bacterium]